MTVWPLIGDDRCGEAFYDRLTIILAGTFSTDRRSGVGRCAEMVVIRGFTVCVDERYSKPNKTYFGEDAIDTFFNDRINESEYYCRVIETEFNKPLDMTKKDNEDFKNSTKC